MPEIYQTNVELSSIYIEIRPHYIGNSHTNERGLSAGIDRLPRACSTSLAELSLQLHTTSGVAEIYICNTQRCSFETQFTLTFKLFCDMVKKRVPGKDAS